MDEARLREEFELVRDQYEQSSETRVSHILVEGSRESRQARIAEAQAALAGGMEFSAAAEQFSDDIGSAGNGGDLGYSDGETFPEAMEQAISELPLGEVSAPVETDAGTHLLLVTDRRAGTAVTLEDVRGELTVSLQDRDASAALLRDVELLRDLAFNAADLEQPAENSTQRRLFNVRRRSRAVSARACSQTRSYCRRPSPAKCSSKVITVK